MDSIIKKNLATWTRGNLFTRSLKEVEVDTTISLYHWWDRCPFCQNKEAKYMNKASEETCHCRKSQAS